MATTPDGPRKEGLLKASGLAENGVDCWILSPYFPAIMKILWLLGQGTHDHPFPKWLSPVWELIHSVHPWQRVESNSKNTAPHPATAIHTAAPERKKPGEKCGKLASAEADSGRADSILFMGSYRKS